MYEIITHRIGSWALCPLINGDYTGVDEGDDALLSGWIDWSTDDWSDSDGNTWVFSHWGNVYNHNEFAECEITCLHGDTYDIDAVFKLKPRS